MKTNTLSKIGMIVIGITVFAFVAYSLFENVRIAEASAPSGLQATVASSTAEVVLAASAVNIAATSTCAARIISTTQQGIMLTMSDFSGQTPTQTFGLWQAASTTVSYDSGQYGCGLIKAIANGANTNITVVVTN